MILIENVRILDIEYQHSHKKKLKRNEKDIKF